MRNTHLLEQNLRWIDPGAEIRARAEIFCTFPQVNERRSFKLSAGDV